MTTSTALPLPGTVPDFSPGDHVRVRIGPGRIVTTHADGPFIEHDGGFALPVTGVGLVALHDVNPGGTPTECPACTFQNDSLVNPEGLKCARCGTELEKK